MNSITEQADQLKHDLESAFIPDSTRVGGGPSSPTYPHPIEPFMTKETMKIRDKLQDLQMYYLQVSFFIVLFICLNLHNDINVLFSYHII